MANARARTSSSFIMHLLRRLSCDSFRGRVLRKVEGADAFQAMRAFQHLGMPERTNGVVVAGCPVFLHRAAGGLEILRDPFITPGVIDELGWLVGFICRLLW